MKLSKTRTIEFKDFPMTVKDVDEAKGIVTGYFAIFGNRDSDNDIIIPGAFAKTIEERGNKGSNRIKHLLQHDRWQPLAVPVLKEDSKGLYFESAAIGVTSYGKDVMALYASGVYNEHSIGYETIISEQLDDGTREMRELKLWEGSTVTWGANPQTSFEGFKHIENLENIIKTGNLSDATYKQIEYEIALLKSLLSAEKPQEPVDQVKAFRQLLRIKNSITS